MGCVWWDRKGIIHYELLRLSKAINSVLYCEQFKRLEENGEDGSTGLVSSSTTMPDRTHLWQFAKN